MTEPQAGDNRVTRALDAITRVVGRTVAWLIVPMVGSLVYEVTARYVFDAPTLWAYDMTYMLYGTFFMLGSAWTLQRGGHIRTDTFYAEWSPRRRAIVDATCYVLFFLPAMIVFLDLGAEYFWKSFQQPLLNAVARQSHPAMRADPGDDHAYCAARQVRHGAPAFV